MKNQFANLLFVLLAISLKINAQISGEYFCKTKMDNFNDFYLVFFYNGTYSSLLSENTCELITDFGISFGTYKLLHDTIVLTDKLNNYKILIKNQSNKLIILKSFKWMKSLQLKYSGTPSEWIETQNLVIDSIQKIQSKGNIIFQKGDLYFSARLVLGTYKNLEGMELKFTKDKYKFYVNQEFNLSEGTWKQVGNILLLYDSNIGATFKMLLTKENKLISSYLPANFGYMVFEKNP